METQSNLGFNESLLDRSNLFYSVSLQQFKVQKAIQGIKVKVSRVKETSKYKKVLGSVYNSSAPDDDEVEEFDYTILIQVNEMKKLFQKNNNTMDFMDNDYVIHKGDVISYSRGNQKFEFKVTEVENFSDVKGVLYRYTIMGLKEYNNIK